MWRFIDGAKPPQNSAKTTDAQRSDRKRTYDSGYDRNASQRKFLPKWFIGHPWLNESESGMICALCQKHETVLRSMGVMQSRVFLDGCTTSYKAESVAIHEKSNAHKTAVKIDNNKSDSEKAPATKAMLAPNEAHMAKLKILFCNAHALTKHGKSFRNYKWLCKLDEAKVGCIEMVIVCCCWKYIIIVC